MSFIFYILGSAAAIGLIAWLVHRLGYSVPHSFEDENKARDAFLSEFPEAEIVRLDLSTDSTAALMQLAGEDRFGVARAMGRFPISRMFARADIVRVQCIATKLIVHMRDYADPGFSLQLDDEMKAKDWKDLLTAHENGRS